MFFPLFLYIENYDFYSNRSTQEATVANTRAVHLEVVTSQPITGRFNSSVYAICQPEVTVAKLFESETIRETLSSIWVLNGNSSPRQRHGTVNLIGLMKTTSTKLYGRSYVTLETVTLPVQTVVSEIEVIVNDRPLTYVSSSFA